MSAIGRASFAMHDSETMLPYQALSTIIALAPQLSLFSMEAGGGFKCREIGVTLHRELDHDGFAFVATAQ